MKNLDDHFEFTITISSHSLCSDRHEAANGHFTSTQIIEVG